MLKPFYTGLYSSQVFFQEHKIKKTGPGVYYINNKFKKYPGR